ncbi:MAG TPA: MFS transporter [Thermoleophilaceae bacterium]
MNVHASRLRLLTPLRRRDFGLLWIGAAVSLLGDGIYFVAIAWQAYELSNAPTALSLVGVAWTLPTVVFLLFGGAISDRLERRRVLIAASATEALAIGVIGVLSVSGHLELWMLLVPVAVYGAAEAFFLPAFEAIVPTLVPPDDYTAAAALDNFMRPLAMQLVGPAVGGILVALASPGVAFLVDAATFLVAVCALSMMRPGHRPAAGAKSAREAIGEIAEGFRFVRANAWLWGTLGAACLSLLAYFGPYQVLVPYLVKNSLHGGGAMFGAIRAAGGVGAILSAAAIAQAGLPRRCVSLMFAAWSIEALLLVGFAVASGAWVFALIALVSGGLAAAGNVVWGTLMKALVPNEMLGRVSSFDWLVSIGLIPLSFAITGPIAEAIGAETTLVLAGVIGAIATISFLAVPGVRSPERELSGLVAPVASET